MLNNLCMFVRDELPGQIGAAKKANVADARTSGT